MTHPNEIAGQLIQLARDLDAAVKELQRLDESAIRAKSRFEVENARAFLSAEGSMDIRKHTATIKTSDRKLDAEIAESRVRAQKELVRTIGIRIDVGRTLSATVRSEIALAGVS